jgi:hypothetical protein
MPPRFFGQVLFTDGVVRNVYADGDGRQFVFDSRWMRVYGNHVLGNDSSCPTTLQPDQSRACASCAS